MSSPVRIPDFSKPPKSTQDPTPLSKSPVTKKIVLVKKPDYIFKGILFSTLSLFVLVGVFFIYNYSLDFLDTKEKATEQKFVFENSLLRGDRSRVIALEAGSNREMVRGTIIQALNNEQLSSGEISIITPAYLRDTLVNGERTLVSEPQRGDDFFFTFSVRAPLNLRALAADKYALGKVGIEGSDIGTPNGFYMFSVTSAPDAVREMLRYENQIYYDMKEVLNLDNLVGEFKFIDQSDKNQLLRVGSDDSGIVLVYGFPTPRTVLITSDTETYQRIVSRLK